jgi:hypothetical protein
MSEAIEKAVNTVEPDDEGAKFKDEIKRLKKELEAEKKKTAKAKDAGCNPPGEVKTKIPDAKNPANFVKVPVRLQLDQQHTEPLPVYVNGKKFTIARGKTVYVPYYVKKHLDEMSAQDENTVRMIAGLRDDMEKSAQALNVAL